MPLTFIQPKALKNDSDSSLTYAYSYGNPSSLKCLQSNTTPCTPLGAQKTYVTTNSGVTNYGCYVPLVASQNDLNNNFAQLYYDSTSPLYLFFKQITSSTYVLYETTDLSTGYAHGTPVAAVDVPGDAVTNSNVGGVTFLATNADGNVIIVGILDDGIDF